MEVFFSFVLKKEKFERIPHCFSLQLQNVQLLNSYVYITNANGNRRDTGLVFHFSEIYNAVELFMNIYI